MIRLIFLITLFVSALSAQSIQVYGEVENAPDHFIVEIVDQTHHLPVSRMFGNPDGHFSGASVDAGAYEIRVTTQFGELLRSVTADVSHVSGPITVRLPDRVTMNRNAGTLVSVKDLTRERRAAFRLLESGKYEQAIAKDPSYALPHHELAVHYLRSRLAGAARREFLTAIELDPKLALAYTNLALADIELGNVAGAEQSAEKGMVLQPGNTKASYVRDLCRFLLGKGPRPAPFTAVSTAR